MVPSDDDSSIDDLSFAGARAAHGATIFGQQHRPEPAHATQATSPARVGRCDDGNCEGRKIGRDTMAGENANIVVDAVDWGRRLRDELIRFPETLANLREGAANFQKV